MAGLRHATEKLQELEDVFAALAHGSRRQILLTIWFRGGKVSSSDIAARFHHAWPTISRHIKILVDAKLLVLEKEGRHRFYRVNLEKLNVARAWLQWFEPDKLSAAKTESTDANPQDGPSDPDRES